MRSSSPAGELLRDEEVETSFDIEDRQADTKVKTAIAWLERTGFLERNENHTRVFQGKLLVGNLAEATKSSPNSTSRPHSAATGSPSCRR